MNRLEDKVALVTGASRGFSAAIAKRLVPESAAGHALTIDSGWREVANMALAFIRHTCASGDSSGCWGSALAQGQIA
jgi:NAD(P)-dependent dehydrogenase (short-subunit alcohol dehydrogenase family)